MYSSSLLFSLTYYILNMFSEISDFTVLKVEVISLQQAVTTQVVTITV